GQFHFETRHRGAATLVVLRRGYLELRQPLTLPLASPLALVLDEQPVALAPLEVAAGRVLATADPDASLGALEVVTTPGAAADVYRALQTFAGLQAVDEGAGLFVRGGSPEETRVFLDEAVVLAPYRYESPTGGFFGTFDPFQLDGIVFSTGGFGARHGDALSGIADLRALGRPSRSSGGASASLAALSGTLALALPHGLGVRAAATRPHTGGMFDLHGTSTDFTHVPARRRRRGPVVHRRVRGGRAARPVRRLVAGHVRARRAGRQRFDRGHAEHARAGRVPAAHHGAALAGARARRVQPAAALDRRVR